MPRRDTPTPHPSGEVFLPTARPPCAGPLRRVAPEPGDLSRPCPGPAPACRTGAD
ncbi:hypothetical protein ACFPM0_08150 [Pseudonocardia sulfidoxydans]|uniref:hypothetical protein n=1 Tax=Pseudonocardia sulfidoxydans TaxID=54011 RepID=UPI003616111D